MDLNFLNAYINPVIFGICLICGFLVKYTTNKIPNRFIPLILTCAGIILTLCNNIPNPINMDLIFSGMCSGLLSTGGYELIRNLVNGNIRSNITVAPQADIQSNQNNITNRDEYQNFMNISSDTETSTTVGSVDPTSNSTNNGGPYDN